MGFGKGDVHVSKPLSNYALSYKQEAKEFITENATKVLPVAKESDKYFTFDRANWRETDDLRAPGTKSNRTAMPALSTSPYLVEEHALHDFVPYREMDEADAPVQPRQDVAAALTEQLLINREVTASQILMTTTAVANSTSLAAASKWDATTGATVIDDIDAGIFTLGQEIGKRGNTVVMGANTWKTVKNHEDVLDRIKYSERGIFTKEILASVLDLDNEVVIGGSVKMTTAEGVTSESVSYIWGNNVLVSYLPTRAMKKGVAHSYLFSTKAGGVQVKEWDAPDYESVKVESALFYDLRIVSSLAGYLIVDAVS